MRFGAAQLLSPENGRVFRANAQITNLLSEYPQARALLRPLLSADEYLNGKNRWCLWLENAAPEAIREIPEVQRRVRAVRAYRAASKREATNRLANFPTVFGERRQPTTKYILIPRHSSELRIYVPISYFTPRYIVSDSCLCLPGASLYEFGVLSSAMHVAWIRQVCGRLKSDFRYSAKLVYNNYPWPDAPKPKQIAEVESAAELVIEIRKRFQGSTLADLYDPIAMPAELAGAHSSLDRAVDLCYRSQSFGTDRQRVEYLFALYEKVTAPLILPPPRKRARSAD